MPLQLSPGQERLAELFLCYLNYFQGQGIHPEGLQFVKDGRTIGSLTLFSATEISPPAEFFRSEKEEDTETTSTDDASPTYELNATDEALLAALKSSSRPIKLTALAEKAEVPYNSYTRTRIKKLVRLGLVSHCRETHCYELTRMSVPKS